MKDFIHLRLHSAYSLAEGALKIDKLVSLCNEHKMPAIAVTDSNNLFGAMDFSIKCSKSGIQPIIGCQLNIKHSKQLGRPTSVLLYAKDADGYQNLIQLVSSAYLHPSSSEHPEITVDTLAENSSGIILLTGGIYGSLGAYLINDERDCAKEYLQFLNRHFDDRLYIELSRHGISEERKIEEKAISLAYDLNLPLIATNNVCYSLPGDFNAHDALICISQSKTIYDSERSISSQEFYFKTKEEMENLFKDLPEAITNTNCVAKRCCFFLKPHKPMMPQFKTDDGKTQSDKLIQIATEGLNEKLEKIKINGKHDDFETVRQTYMDRLDYELNMIDKMGFSGYFLIVADYVQWAKRQNIPVGAGRGSGAGSIVAWSVKITDIDPIRFQLFFERFLNPDRVSMPDFDIDFCQARRDEVISYVQEKYGYQSVAQIVTFGKLQARAVVKDVGRVLAIPYPVADKISKMIPFHPTHPMTLQQAIDADKSFQEFIKSDEQIKNLIEIALRLEGLYRHASVHAAGVVISDQNLQDIIPLYKDPRSCMPVTQFSMKDVENAGLIKFDFLGLKTLTVVQKIIDILKMRGIEVSILDIEMDDKKTFDLLRRVDCVGVFQLESTGMKDVLRKMQPDRIGDLIALVALYRPGPMDDIPKYIACKHGHEEICYLHPKLESILSETYGVMVYQEQVMQIAQVIGGYTLGQADILRRAMGKKNKQEMHDQQKKFVDGAIASGIGLEIAEHLFEQMNKFAGYGFNKSHATPYGLLTYQTAFLKANYRVEFYAAAMTIDMINTDKLYVYYRDAKKSGINITAPDINISSHEFLICYVDANTSESKSTATSDYIVYSLSAIKGSGEHAVKEIVEEREQNGSFTSIFDFAERLSTKKTLNRKLLEHLIKAGAFDKLHSNRHQLYASIDQILSVKLSMEQVSLFEKSYPALASVQEWDNSEKLQHEFLSVGFYISAHPLEKYETILKDRKIVQLIDIENFPKAKIVVIINGISYKTTKHQNKFCILQVSDASCSLEITVFSELLAKARDLLSVGNIVVMKVSCHANDEQLRITAEDIVIFSENDAANETQQERYTKDRIIRVIVSSHKELLAVQQLVSEFKIGGNCVIELEVEGKVVLLNAKYLLSSYDVLDLKSAVGFTKVKDSYVN